MVGDDGIPSSDEIVLKLSRQFPKSCLHLGPEIQLRHYFFLINNQSPAVSIPDSTTIGLQFNDSLDDLQGW